MMNSGVRNTIVALSFLPALLLPKDSYAQLFKNWGKDEPTRQEVLANGLSSDEPSFQAKRTLDPDGFFNGMNTYFIPKDDLPTDSTQRYLANNGTHFNGNTLNIAYARSVEGDQTYHLFAVSQEVLTKLNERLGPFVENVNYKRTGNILNQVRVLDNGQKGQYDESFLIDPDSARIKGDGNGHSDLVEKLKDEYDSFSVLDIDRPSEQDTVGLASYVKNNKLASFYGHAGLVAVDQSRDTVAIRALSKNSGHVLVISEEDMCGAPEVFQKIALGLYELEDENDRLRTINDSLQDVTPDQQHVIDSLQDRLDQTYSQLRDTADEAIADTIAQSIDSTTGPWEKYATFLSKKRMALQDSIADLHDNIDSLESLVGKGAYQDSSEKNAGTVSLDEYKSMVKKYEDKIGRVYGLLEKARESTSQPSESEAYRHRTDNQQSSTRSPQNKRSPQPSTQSTIQESMNKRYNIHNK